MSRRVWYKTTAGYYVAGYYIGDCSGEFVFCGLPLGVLLRCVADVAHVAAGSVPSC